MRGLRVVLAALVLLTLLPWSSAQDNETGNRTADGGGSGDVLGETRTITVDASRLLLTLAAIIGLGFAGFLVFDRFRIADTIFLIGFGIVLSAFGLLDVDLFRAFQPLVAGFALLIIMLDAGLDLRFGDLAAGMGWGIAFSTLTFLLTVGLVGALVHFTVDLSWVLSLILGCAVTDTAGLIILPIVGQLNVPGRVKTALLVDTSLPDVLSVTLVLVLINIALASQEAAAEAGAAVTNVTAPSFDLSGTATDILGGFSLTLLAGFLAGAFWIRALGWLAKRRYAYMTTLAAVLGLNWAVGALGGSGPIAVLAFGLVIGNRALFGPWSKVERPRVFQDMTQFNGEVAFLVRSFFFVYLGLILDLGAFTPWFTFIALLIVAAIVAARAGASYALTLRPGPLRDYRRLLIAMLPRGTTAAVVSTLPATRGVEGTEAFAAYAVVVIMITNLIFTVGLFLFFRKATHPAPEAADDGAAG